MIKLSDKVTKIPGIGPKTQKKLARLEIETVEDLIHHYPFRYEDRSKIEDIENAIRILNNGGKNKTVTIKAELEEIKNIYTRNRKRLTKGKARDETGEIDLIWFNMHYIKKNLRVGETYLMTGKLGLSGNKPSLIVPQMDKERKKNLHAGRIVPIYPQTEGISSRWLRGRINDVIIELEKSDPNLGIDEFLPEKLIEKYDHIPIRKAIKNIHLPENFETLEKARKRIGYNELFLEMLKIEKLKSDWSDNRKGIDIKAPKDVIDKFTKNLPFELTKEQKESVKQILKDMEEEIPMRRLLEGDVGTGKTIVAIISSLAAIQAGKNVLYMAPTEILAEQHFQTFQKFLPEDILKKYNAQIKLKTGRKKEKKKNSDTPIITIGTHALLYSEDKFENIGLVIIDEQHRFGVEQREELVKLNKDETTPHLLTMTATPIPRTLALTLYGDLKLNTLTEKPNKGSKVITKVVPGKRRKDVFKWIAEKKEPTFIVCPFIEESDSPLFSDVKAATIEYEKLKEGPFKNLSVGLLHGRMSSEEKNKVVKKFEEGKLNVLVSTPVIEVGIDIPDATIMVIESAERYGLASLHQLRGRVGRGKKEGYCFVFTSQGHTSVQRLRYLESYNSGLKLAEIDLKMRGPGEVYGVKQHGFSNFKIANLSDTELIDKTKKDAMEIFEEIDKYPKLKKKLEVKRKMT